MADRVGVIDRGRLVLVEETTALMRKFGKLRLTIMMQQRIDAIPPALAGWPLRLEAEGERLVYDFDANAPEPAIPRLLRDLDATGIDYKDLETSRSSLEDIFVDLVEGRA
jgi:ABC-2 type transport system ATP-binding protein